MFSKNPAHWQIMCKRLEINRKTKTDHVQNKIMNVPHIELGNGKWRGMNEIKKEKGINKTTIISKLQTNSLKHTCKIEMMLKAVHSRNLHKYWPSKLPYQLIKESDRVCNYLFIANS